MKITARDQKVLVLGLIGVVAILGWMYVVSPMQQRWTDAKNRLAASEESLSKLSSVAGDREYYAQERERVSRMVREVADLESSQTVVPALINEVQRLGQVHGIQIDRYEPLAPRVEDAYSVYSLSLSFHSSLAGIVSFVADVQEARPVIAVRRMHVVPPGANSESKDLSVELMLSTFAIQTLGDYEADEAEAALVAEAGAG